MKKPPPRPYRSLTPWTGFTELERKRKVPLAVCPSPTCRRARACLRATDDLYCRRTHLTIAEQRQERLKAPPPKGGRLLRMTLPKDPEPDEIAEYRAHVEEAIERQKAALAKMTARWKDGEFDQLYGKYDRRGALMMPPEKTYVDLRRSENAPLTPPPSRPCGSRPSGGPSP